MLPARLPGHLALLIIVAFSGACAAPRLQASLPESQRASMSNRQAIMADGFVLPLDTWTPQTEVRSVVLALHGFNDYRHAFATVGSYFARRGIVTVAYDQRGFGETAGRGVWPGSDRMARDAKAMIALLRSRYPGLPLYILGESMGGAVALATLARAHPPAVDGVILIAPAVWGRSTMPWYQRLALWIGAHTFPGMTVTGKGLDITPSDNLEMLRALGDDPLVIKETRIDAVFGLANLMDEALVKAQWLTKPSLIAYGQRDEIIPREPTCRMLNALPRAPAGTLPRLVIYPQGYHMLTRDLQADTVLEDMATWILDRQAELPSGHEQGTDTLGADCARLWR